MIFESIKQILLLILVYITGVCYADMKMKISLLLSPHNYWGKLGKLLVVCCWYMNEYFHCEKNWKSHQCNANCRELLLHCLPLEVENFSFLNLSMQRSCLHSLLYIALKFQLFLIEMNSTAHIFPLSGCFPIWMFTQFIWSWKKEFTQWCLLLMWLVWRVEMEC